MHPAPSEWRKRQDAQTKEATTLAVILTVLTAFNVAAFTLALMNTVHVINILKG